MKQHFIFLKSSRFPFFTLWLISFVLLAGSCSNKKLLAVDKLESFKVTSKNLKRGVWDSKISNTNKGENCSPELSWKKVEGATQYAVFMIDGGWLHMDVFTEETSLEEGIVTGKNRGFQYIGPYPPKGSTHTYPAQYLP